jgi:hypothetical protein
MSLAIDKDMRKHLDRVRGGIAREFEQVPQHEVNERFERIVRQLVSEATFLDFVPVLAWRYSREALRTVEGLPAEFRADS